MIRFIAPKRDGGALIGLGITAANVERLKMGRPIFLDLDVLARGLREGSMSLERASIAIFYGDSEDQIQADFERAGVSLGEVRDERAEDPIDRATGEGRR